MSIHRRPVRRWGMTEPDTNSRTRQHLVLTLACAAMAMVGLDTAIANVALPSIQRDLGMSRGALQWVVVAYGLLLGGFLLVGGRMVDNFGRRRMFVAGLAAFTLASLLAGTAHHAGLLIAARAAQGFGAALIVPSALSLLAVTFADGPERDRALGLFGAAGGAAGSVGVVAGGLLAAGPGWRWAYFINVPAGIGFIVLAAGFLAPDRSGDRAPRLNIGGAVTVTAGLLIFVYAVHHPMWFPAAALLLALFARIEARAANPLVPAALLRNRSLVASNVTAFLASCALLSFIFIGSLFMQQALGYSPATTGLAWLATTVTVFPASMAGARLVSVAGVRRMLFTGLSVLAAGALWLALGHDGYVTGLLPAFLLTGLGFGLCGPALQIGALTGVQRSSAGLASGLVETMREVGGAAGVAAVSAVLVAGTGGFRAAFAGVSVLAVLGVVSACFIPARSIPGRPIPARSIPARS
jgi:MFS family permease